MQDYNFWKDAFDTYQSLSAPLQLAWLLLPPTYLLVLIGLILRFWWRCRQLGPIGDDPGRPLFTIQRNAHGAYDIYIHDTEGVLSTQMRNTASAGEQRMVRQLQLGRNTAAARDRE